MIMSIKMTLSRNAKPGNKIKINGIWLRIISLCPKGAYVADGETSQFIEWGTEIEAWKKY